jgi:anti-sigma factor RsiW
MSDGLERELMRLLHGELPADRARQLRSELDSDPALAATFARLEESWQALSLPPPPVAPPGFAKRVAARAVADRAAEWVSWGLAPAWARAVAVAALSLGLALGVALGSWPSAGADSWQAEDLYATSEATLAEGLWIALDEEAGSSSPGEEL